MLNTRPERVARTMELTGQAEMQAVGTERSRNFVNAAFRRNPRHMPDWAARPSWSN